ncbi:hypothetical protein AAE02nite_21430 [Adhaeribacter aerolatus]|uniref:VapC45 PIN like domain-containing protein n=1 Tax=Adhaeribacter aerolatus TaxID=670289 RepID=A0A512AXN4_9BACT|nr:hypothetical protein [Adhaeribacter aerolatus]GEO04479.1 hypothetical protein AAE02nite_21430 [Adhaeribacter aerolatus]
MIIYLDENMPSSLADALNILQAPRNTESRKIEVKSIKKVFGAGTKDEDWIPIARKECAIVITQDYNIQRTRHQKALCDANNLGLFYLRSPSKSGLLYWDMVGLLIEQWPEITKICFKESKPFAYRCSLRKSLEKI